MKERLHLTEATVLDNLSPDSPVLIAGPTASGKSALALRIAQAQGGRVINADASQVYRCWRVLTARPTTAECAVAPHALYGHVEAATPYSVGHWLRDAAPLVETGPRPRPRHGSDRHPGHFECSRSSRA